VFGLTGSAFLTSLLVTLELLPYLALGLFAGALADRVDRRRLMVACDLLSAALIGSIPVAAALDALTVAHIFVVALLTSSVFVWFDAASFGALPAIVGTDRIVAANSALWSAQTAANVVGPALGGFLAATIGSATALSLDAFSFALSAALILLIPRALSTAAPIGTKDADPLPLLQRTRVDIKEGLAWLWGHALVRALTLLGFGVSLSGGAVMGLLVVFGIRELGLSSAGGSIGLLYAVGATGSLLASVLLPRLSDLISPERVTLVALLANPPLLVGLALAPSFGFALAAILFWQLTYSLIVINGVSIRQMVVPDHLQSRVNTTARMIAWGGTPFGAALGGILAEAISVRAAYLLMALGVLASAAVGWFSPLRKRDQQNSETPSRQTT
jgi:MFS family permease